MNHIDGRMVKLQSLTPKEQLEKPEDYLEWMAFWRALRLHMQECVEQTRCEDIELIEKYTAKYGSAVTHDALTDIVKMLKETR